MTPLQGAKFRFAAHSRCRIAANVADIDVGTLVQNLGLHGPAFGANGHPARGIGPGVDSPGEHAVVQVVDPDLRREMEDEEE